MKNNQKKKINKKEKIKNNSILKGLIIIGLYFVVALVLEIVNFSALKFGVVPRVILFDLAFIFIVCGLLFLISNNTAKLVISAVLLAVQIVLNVVNSILIRNTGLIFHLKQLADIGSGTECLEPNMINYGLLFGYIIIFAIFLTGSIILNIKFKKDITLEFRKKIAVWLSSVFVFVLIGSSFAFIGTSVRKDIQKQAYSFASDGGKGVLSGVYMKNATMKMMGTFGYYFNDLCTLISNAGYASESERQAVLEDLKTGVVKNENAFNISKNDNLIYILLESFDGFSIDPYNTPNLWKLAYGETKDTANKNVKWGYRFDNFYGLNYTNDSEYISLLGHTTEKFRFDSNYKKVGLTTPYSLPNLFKNAKYQSVNYFHAYKKDYYDRDKIYSAIGFENVYGIEDAKLTNPSREFGDWVLDSEYIKAMMDKFIPVGKSFFSYYTTISTHGPYHYDNNRFDSYKTEYDKNIENYKKYLESIGYAYPEDKKTAEELRQYKAGVMDTDLMIGLIFEDLTKKGILDSTTIILFSDHNCFYNDLNAKIKKIKGRNFDNIALYNIPFIIYNDAIASRSSTNFCNTYDLYPTICDMFGFEYNSKVTQGVSIFGSYLKNSLHISFKHGIFNKDYYTEDLISIKQINENPAMTIDEFKVTAYEFFKKQETIEFVYRNNVYKK